MHGEENENVPCFFFFDRNSVYPKIIRRGSSRP